MDMNNNMLLHDEDTNVVFLSPWLKDEKEGHPEFYQRLTNMLNPNRPLGPQIGDFT